MLKLFKKYGDPENLRPNQAGGGNDGAAGGGNSGGSGSAGAVGTGAPN